MVSKTEKKLPGVPKTVTEALDRFWKCGAGSNHVPDYVGFMEWIDTEVQRDISAPTLPIHALTELPGRAQLTLELVAAAKNVGIEFTKDGAKPNRATFGRTNGRPNLKAINRGKLLLSFFTSISARQLEFLAMLAVGSETAPSSANPSSSQAQHRDAFFRAVEHGDQRSAAKMLGRLREEQHDVGELAFFEATEAFHSKHYDEAVAHARSVPETAIDWPRAFMLILESYAYLGEVEAIEAEVNGAPGFTFPPFFIPYIYQVAVENSRDPEVYVEKLLPIIGESIKSSNPEAGIFHMWNRHSCGVAVEFVEQWQEQALRIEATKQGGGSVVEEQPEPTLRSRQIQGALLLDSDLAARIVQAGPDEIIQGNSKSAGQLEGHSA